jgi:superfamily II DNA or RNA helicase
VKYEQSWGIIVSPTGGGRTFFGVDIVDSPSVSSVD